MTPPTADPVLGAETGAGQSVHGLAAAVDQGAVPDRFTQMQEESTPGVASQVPSEMRGSMRKVIVIASFDIMVTGVSGFPCFPLLQPVLVTVTRKAVASGRRL